MSRLSMSRQSIYCLFLSSLGVLMLGLPLSVQARSQSFSKNGLQITVEPIVGYELNRRDTPTPHSKFMLVYGGRVTAGYKILSGELEYTQGQDTEVFVDQSLTVKEKRQSAKFGARSRYSITSWLDVLGRLGGQASKKAVETSSSLTNTTVEIKPYFGLGLEGAIVNAFSLSLESVYVIRSFSELQQNELQTSVSLKIGI